MSRFARDVAFVFVAGALLALSAGCPSPEPTAASPHVFTVIDRTTPGCLPRERSRTAGTLARLRNDVRAGIFTLDQVCEEIFSPDQNIPSRGDLLGKLVERVKPVLSRGTFAHNAWKAFEKATRGSSTPTVLIFETNGDQDDHSENARRQTHEAILALARNSCIKRVLIIGVDPINVARVRDELAPFGSRVRLLDKAVSETLVVDLSSEALRVTTPTKDGGVI